MSRAEPNRWLKLKAKQLIKACGGLEEASRVCAEECRPYSVPQLSRCQVATAPDYLPIDIVFALEAYCGEPIVTGAMAEARPAVVTAGAVRDEVSDIVERGADALRAVRAALADDGRIDAREACDIAAQLETLAADVREAQAALERETRARAA